jgi:phenylpyruvate tautomerase PptA (4-oxalocrotonate tautomerase family)
MFFSVLLFSFSSLFRDKGPKKTYERQKIDRNISGFLRDNWNDLVKEARDGKKIKWAPVAAEKSKRVIKKLVNVVTKTTHYSAEHVTYALKEVWKDKWRLYREGEVVGKRRRQRARCNYVLSFFVVSR